MTPLEIMEARLAELRKEHAALSEHRGALIDKAAAEQRGFTDTEQADYDAAGSKREQLERDIVPVKARVEELRSQAVREDAAASVRSTEGEHRTVATVKDPEVYVRDGGTGHSYFRDLAKAQVFGDDSARDRLTRHAKAAADTEKRALGNTNTTGGSGGEFAPPAWLISDYIALARAGRVTADLFTHSDVPAGVSSVNLPRVVTGTTVALQSTQNSALSQTDLATSFVGTGFATVGGKQVVSQQLLDQSGINFDQVITQDLAAAYAQNIGSQVILGAGAGANNNSVVNGLVNATVAGANQSTFTSASPTVALFYSKAAGMISAFVTNRFAEPTVWLMHPRRFYWLLAQTDGNGRPLVVPVQMGNQSVNAMGTASGGTAAGATGFVFLGLPVFIDPQLPTNLGSGTNQDEVFLLKQDDLWLFESPPQPEVFREPYADTVGVLFRLYSYVGTILNRYTTSIATMNGTGLVAPTF